MQANVFGAWAVLMSVNERGAQWLLGYWRRGWVSSSNQVEVAEDTKDEAEKLHLLTTH